MDLIGWHYTFINLTRNRTLRKIARFVVFFFFFNIMFSRVDGDEQKRNIFSCYFLFKRKSYYKIIQRNQNDEEGIQVRLGLRIQGLWNGNSRC